jgi:hypothetical protein
VSATKTDIEELQEILRGLNRVLVLVALLGLIFTCVSVTLFAIQNGVNPAIAWLLDPMVSIVLGSILIVDGRLSKWAEHATRSSPSAAALRWFSGLATWSMNVWSSLWPDGGFGTPDHMNVAGFWLHSIPPLLLILMAEAATAYRHRIATIIAKITGSQRRAATPAPRASASPRPATASAPVPAPAATPSLPVPAPASEPPATPSQPAASPAAAKAPAKAPATAAAPETATAGGSEARDLDDVAATYRALAGALGRAPSDRALADALGVGRSRAQQLRTAAIEAGHSDLTKLLRAAS